MLPQAYGAVPGAAALGAGGSTTPGASPQAHLDFMRNYQMEYMQRLQYAQVQAAMVSFGGPMGKGMSPMGAADGGLSAAYASGLFAKGKGKKGKGKPKGYGAYGKGKGKFKGKDADGEGDKADDGDDAAEGEGKEEGYERSPKRENRFSPIVNAQREAHHRFEKESRVSPIVNAQREARQRFEKDILDKIQGRWVDEADPNTSYVVEGNICSVSSANGGRGFRNRLSVYGVEMCWDARRFWHYLNLQELHKPGDPPERLEWNPAKDSPPTQQIVWLKAPPLPEGETDAEDKPAADAPTTELTAGLPQEQANAMASAIASAVGVVESVESAAAA